MTNEEIENTPDRQPVWVVYPDQNMIAKHLFSSESQNMNGPCVKVYWFKDDPCSELYAITKDSVFLTKKEARKALPALRAKWLDGCIREVESNVHYEEKCRDKAIRAATKRVNEEKKVLEYLLAERKKITNRMKRTK